MTFSELSFVFSEGPSELRVCPYCSRHQWPQASRRFRPITAWLASVNHQTRNARRWLLCIVLRGRLNEGRSIGRLWADIEYTGTHQKEIRKKFPLAYPCCHRHSFVVPQCWKVCLRSLDGLCAKAPGCMITSSTRICGSEGPTRPRTVEAECYKFSKGCLRKPATLWPFLVGVTTRHLKSSFKRARDYHVSIGINKRNHFWRLPYHYSLDTNPITFQSPPCGPRDTPRTALLLKLMGPRCYSPWITYTHTPTHHISWPVAIISQLNASGWELIYITSAPMADGLFTRPRFSSRSAQTSWNQLCERASSAVSLFAGSKFVRPPIRSLRSESRGSIFHRTNGSRGFSLLKPPRSASSTWHQGLSPRCLNSPSKLSRSAKYEIWRSRTWASASSPSGSVFSSTYKMTCFSTA